LRERLLQVVDDVVAAHRREHETALTAGIERVLKAVEQVGVSFPARLVGRR
jgi:hypothetical protein